MSAITGIGDSVTIDRRASTSLSRGTATRTRSEPASATSRICLIVASTLAVSVLVMVWTTTGAPPPIGTSFTHIWRLEAIWLTGYRGTPSKREYGALMEIRVGGIERAAPGARTTTRDEARWGGVPPPRPRACGNWRMRPRRTPSPLDRARQLPSEQDPRGVPGHDRRS